MDKENIHIDLDKEIVTFINNRTKDTIDISKSIKDIVYLLLEEENISINSVSVSIESANKNDIKKINKEYRNIDRATDVLSFPIFNKAELDKLKLEKERKKIKELELGDIILCLDVIEEQSIEYRTGITREVLYMITHGVCHLLGYDHEVEEEKTNMRQLEEKILSRIGVGK